MPLHPEAQALLDALAAQGVPPFECMTVPQAREATAAFLDLQPPREEVASVEDRDGPGAGRRHPGAHLHPGRRRHGPDAASSCTSTAAAG